MLYFNSNNRKKAINDIKMLNIKLNSIPGNYLSYLEVTNIQSYLKLLLNEIEKEELMYKE